MTISTTEALAGSAGGGLPVPAEPRRSSTITITERDGAKVTVSTWNVCHGVSRFVELATMRRELDLKGFTVDV